MSQDDIGLAIARAATVAASLRQALDRLSHVYPDDPAMQAGQLNRVQAASATALEAVDGAEAWLARRGP